MSKWISEEVWRNALATRQTYLGEIEDHGLYTVKFVNDQRRAGERIWQAGRPEWRAKGRPGRLP